MRADVLKMMERELAKSRELLNIAMRPGVHPDVGVTAHALLSLSYVVETLLAEHAEGKGG